MTQRVNSRVYVKLTEYLFRCLKADVNYSIAKVLIERIEEFPDIYIEEIAFHARTTPASVTKFCKRLGYPSFKDMRTDIGEYSKIHLLDDFQSLTNPDELIEYFLEKDREVEEFILEHLDKTQCERIAQTLSTQKKIAVLGSTYSASNVNLFRELFSQENFIVYEIHRRTEKELLRQILHEVDAVFVISLTGEWVKENLDLLLENKSLSSYILTYQPKQEISECFTEVISFQAFDFSMSSSFYSQKIIRLWVVLLNIYMVTSKNSHLS
ncbi:transcriptional regulator, RpiR family [Pilibacter termitis]|uniref:Transcriptional regulator, RpiR family n=1 Tax=Pilibacter termitis TaxID=263852 RepID=A0A1T4R0N1_9ENTE|nr:MurR/RpiR family transcriptional regulator [Pilibacter termitis]SKA09559.1 transcriptional regulator, RpiR family [Pilibacter termitis]